VNAVQVTLQPDSESGIIVAVDLSEAINTAFLETRNAAVTTTATARDAVTRALECGRLLNRQKASLARGAWQTWLAEHCPEISAPTARRYMSLARSHVSVIEDTAGLRKAYLATGILSETPRIRPAPDANTPAVTFVRGLDDFRRWYHRRTEELPLDRWTPEARRLLRNELVWFKKLYDRLA
jgi:hypothetical protein